VAPGEPAARRASAPTTGDEAASAFQPVEQQHGALGAQRVGKNQRDEFVDQIGHAGRGLLPGSASAQPLDRDAVNASGQRTQVSRVSSHDDVPALRRGCDHGGVDGIGAPGVGQDLPCALGKLGCQRFECPTVE